MFSKSVRYWHKCKFFSITYFALLSGWSFFSRLVWLAIFYVYAVMVTVKIKFQFSVIIEQRTGQTLSPCPLFCVIALWIKYSKPLS